MMIIARRVIASMLTLALLLGWAAFGATGASAQGQDTTAAPGVWVSSINIQNVGSSAAAVSIVFYNASGATVATYNASPDIAANSSLSIYVPSQVSGLTPGQFSAVASSSQPINVSVNLTTTGNTSAPWTATAYQGIDSTNTGTTLYFPGLYKSYYGYQSEIVVQNAGSASTNLTATFYNKAGTQVASVSLGSLAANVSKTFPMSSLSAVPSGNTNGIFGAVVTSSGSVPLAGIANMWLPASGSVKAGTSSYNAATSGSTTLYAPSLHNNYYGFNSALTVQNISTTNASVSIKYSNGTVRTTTLAPKAAESFYQPADTALPSGKQQGLLSATITATGGSVIGLVNTQLGTGPGGDFASYNVPSVASSQYSIPNLMSDYYNYFSAVTVQNVGTTATNITITYSTGQTRTYSNVAANGTVNFINLGSANVLPTKQSISATVSSSNGNKLVAVVQHNTDASLSSYPGATKAVGDYLIALAGVAK